VKSHGFIAALVVVECFFTVVNPGKFDDVLLDKDNCADVFFVRITGKIFLLRSTLKSLITFA
jgi:hypothetical protein